MTPASDADPSVVMLSRPSFDADAVSKALLADGFEWQRTQGATAAEELIEFAGRVCYMSFGPHHQSSRSNSEYIRNLIDQGHESVLEHASWTFLLSGVSRAFSHQLVRHRVGFAFSQLSQQYADQSEMPARIPVALRDSEQLRDAWLHAIEVSRTAYREILEVLQASEEVGHEGLSKKERRRLFRTAARSVLPEATVTRIVFSANARALRNFLKVRGAIAGDEEMRLVSALILGELKVEAPTVFSDFELTEEGGVPLVKLAGND
jgi:thymidylate synthase (FAD)